MAGNFRKPGVFQHNVSRAVLKNVRKARGIVFGGQAIKRKLGINARPTKDFDVFVQKPKQIANQTQADLDKQTRRDHFYSKKGTNPGTYKVKSRGMDEIRGTEDDVGIADFTRTPKPEPKTFTFRGVRYRNLNEELAAKAKLLRDKQFAFRRKKDFEDFKRIIKFGRGR